MWLNKNRFFQNLSDENRYYIRDFFIFLFTLFISVVFSEIIFFGKEDEISIFQKIDTYLFILIPFFILSLILSYIYRNKRNLETGKIRSSIRYRLTLAFLFVALIPSLPIFILSSNLTGKLIEGLYRVDISNALKSASVLVSKEEANTNANLLMKVKVFKESLEKDRNYDGYSVFKKAVEMDLFQKDDYYLGFFRKGSSQFETIAIAKFMDSNDFLQTTHSGILNSRLYLSDRAYTVFSFYLNEDVEIRVGQKIHKGNEEDVRNIVNATSTYEKVSLWREKSQVVFE